MATFPEQVGTRGNIDQAKHAVRDRVWRRPTDFYGTAAAAERLTELTE